MDILTPQHTSHVWICFIDYNANGCSVPLAVFDNEEKARAWVAENPRGEFGVYDVE